MKKLFLTLLLLPALFLSGCGIAYQTQRAQLLSSPTTNYGPPPPSNYREIASSFLRGYLKDPASAIFEFSAPNKNAIQPADFSPQAVPVWTMLVSVNAKNSFGGYTGAQLWALAWQNGRIIAYAAPWVSDYGYTGQPGYWNYV